MKNRKQILKKLINFEDDLDCLSLELSKYKWDVNSPIVIMNNLNFIRVLEKIINENNDFKELEDWANLIECRDDIDFENEKLKNLIFEFANPLLYGVITKNKLLKIIEELTNI